MALTEHDGPPSLREPTAGAAFESVAQALEVFGADRSIDRMR
jgi:hypothetical protein